MAKGKKKHLKVVASTAAPTPPRRAWPTAIDDAEVRRMHPGPNRLTGQRLPTLEELKSELLSIAIEEGIDEGQRGAGAWGAGASRKHSLALAIVTRTAK